MTVKELIEKLQSLPQDNVVIMSKDGEGNEYSPLSDMSVGLYAAETTWRGDYYDPKDIESEERSSYDPVVCLWPVN